MNTPSLGEILYAPYIPLYSVTSFDLDGNKIVLNESMWKSFTSELDESVSEPK